MRRGKNPVKKVIWVLIVVLFLGALDLLPFRSKELADLLPVKTVIITRSGAEYTVDVGAGVKAVGDTLSEALKRLQEQTSEDLFLPTAEQVVLTEPADEAAEAVAEESAFRPAAGICRTPDPAPDPNALGRYLQTHPSDYTIVDLQAAIAEGREPEIPVILPVGGGYRFED